MGKFQIILNNFGMQAFKPLQITSKEFDTQTAVATPRFDTGRDLPRTGMLGTPIFSDLILSYEEQIFNFDIVLIEITGRKLITETHVVGRDGSVKEFIANADKAINIKTVLLSQYPEQYPTELVKNFEKLMQVNNTLNAISPVLDLFGINALVIKDYKLRQSEGQMNVVPVEITAIEDKYLDILVNV